MKSLMLQENICQARAVQLLCPKGEPWAEVCICRTYGAKWREIINAYEAQHGRCPTEHDILWIHSEELGEDLRERVRREILNYD